MANARFQKTNGRRDFAALAVVPIQKSWNRSEGALRFEYKEGKMLVVGREAVAREGEPVKTNGWGGTTFFI